MTILLSRNFSYKLSANYFASTAFLPAKRGRFRSSPRFTTERIVHNFILSSCTSGVYSCHGI